MRVGFALTAYPRFARACAGAARLRAGASMAQSAAIAASAADSQELMKPQLDERSEDPGRSGRPSEARAGTCAREDAP